MYKKILKKTVVGPLVISKWYMDKPVLKLSNMQWLLYWNIHIKSFAVNRRFPNLQNGESLNDKINWLKIFDQDEIKIKLADKIEVKNFIYECLGSDTYYADILRIYGDNEAIDISALPTRFFLKTNHDTNGVAFIDKNNMSKDEINKKINKMQRHKNEKHGFYSGEWHYLFIKPRIFAEEFIGSSTDLPPEYRIYCSDGKVLWITYIANNNGVQEKIILPGESSNDFMENIASEKLDDFNFPSNWHELMDIASRLSRGLRFVRVDLFNEDNKPKVGELTFTTQAGFFDVSIYLNKLGKDINGQNYLGSLLQLDRSLKKFPIYSEYINEAGFSLRDKL